MAFKDCVQSAINVAAEDTDAVLAAHDRYQANGIVGDAATRGAIEDVIASVQRERQETLDMVYEQHPDLVPAIPEAPEIPETGNIVAPDIAEKPDHKLAARIADRIGEGEAITWQELFTMADESYGGTQAEGRYTPKDAYDAMEMGLNLAILDSGEFFHGAYTENHQPKQREALNTLFKMMEQLPTQTKRTEEQDALQQYSTPPLHSFVAAWVANLTPNDVVLEPSAGTGNLAVHALKANVPNENIHVNELSDRRADLIEGLFDNVTRENASYINSVLPKEIKPTVVIMNPPFSADVNLKGRKDQLLGAKHVEEALRRLEPAGRLVAILGRGMEPGRARTRTWWEKIQKKYNVRANVQVSGAEYRKFGTTFDNQFVVIDNTGSTTDVGAIITGRVESVADLLPMIGDIRDDRIHRTEQPPAEPGVEAQAPAAEGEAGRPGDLFPAAGERGARPEGARPTEGGRPRDRGDGGAVDVGTTEPVDGLPADERGRGGGELQPAPAGEPAPTETGATSIAVDQAEDDSGVLIENADVTPVEIGTSSFEQYRSPLKITGAKPHPTKLAESAAMSAVKAPDVSYVPHIPKAVINSGKLSDVQLESIARAGQAHTVTLPDGSRKGFFIGDGCVSGDTRIFDPLTGKHDSIKSLAEKREPITVLSLTESGFEPFAATAPFVKGEAEIYRVELESGRSVSVTSNHRFLTRNGWRRIIDGLSVGDHVASAETSQIPHISADRSDHLENAENYSQKPEDCLGNCSAYSRQYGVQPLLSKGSVRVFFPLPDDARAYIPDYRNLDDYVFSQEHNHRYQCSGRLSRNNFSQALTRAPSLISIQALEVYAQSSLVKHQEHQQSLSEKELLHCSSVSTPDHQQAHAYDLSATLNAFEHCAYADGTRLPQVSRHSQSQSLSCAHQQDNAQSSRIHARFSSIYDSRWDGVRSIRYIGTEAFYDLYVPGPENYVAEGVVHHNTGVGKGAQVAGIILDNIAQGRKKAVWVSENQKLFEDAKRDTHWVGGNIKKLFKHAGLKGDIKATEGVLFTTYDTMRSKGKDIKDASGKVITPGKARLDQIVDWLGEDFDGVIAFDEAHNMANALDQKGTRGIKKASMKALAGIDLQKRLPNARIVYVSATGATEVENLGYAERLGLWGEGTPFPDKANFVNEIKAGGVASMEVVAKDLKSMGVYTSRSLSYDDVEYSTIEHPLTDNQRFAYDELATAWQVVLENVNEALVATGAVTEEQTNGAAKSAAYSAFWGSHQRFFNQVLTGMQMPSVITDIEAQLEAGKSAVLQLVNTNEAVQERRMNQAADAGITLDEVDITPRDILMQYVTNGFPVNQYEQYTDDDGNIRSRPAMDSQGNHIINPEAVEKREAMLDRIGALDVPEGPLEQVINNFGSDAVAEITGRKRRLVRSPDGTVKEEKLGTAKTKKDADDFMAGKKRILIFSDAGGTGRSYHASNTVKNKQQRIHYLVQPGWRADKAVQGTGRTHRTNQANAPHYKLVTTDLKAQRRFISTIARRLDQLGALTKGQRDTTSQGMFSADMNLEGEYGEAALQALISDLHAGRIEGLTMDDFIGQTGIDLIDAETGAINQSKMPDVPKFLNRLLSMTITDMDLMFMEFYTRLEGVIEYAKEQGTYDSGMETVKADKIRKIEEQDIPDRTTKYVKVETENPAVHIQFDDLPKKATFARNKSSGKLFAFADAQTITDNAGNLVRRKRRISPAGGTYETEAKFLSKYNVETLSDEQARAEWDADMAKLSPVKKSTMHMITGELLSVWDRLPASQPRIIRMITDDGEVLLGREIRNKDIGDVLKALGLTVTVPKKTAAEWMNEVLEQGATLTLSNGWQIVRRRVSGQNRIEVTGASFREADIVKNQGGFSERIAYQSRLFLPTDDAAVFERVISNKPVIEVFYPESKVGEEIAEYAEEKATYTEISEPGANEPQLDLFTDNPLFPGKVAEFKSATEAVQVGTFDIEFDAITTDEQAAQAMQPLAYEASENFVTLVLDANDRPIAVLRQFFGTVDGASVYPREVVTLTHMIPGAEKIYFSHNHPSGIPDPSEADKHITQRLESAFKDTGIEFKGHVIVAPVSMTKAAATGFGVGIQERYGLKAEAVQDRSVVQVPEFRGRRYTKFEQAGEAITSPEQSARLLKDKPEGIYLLNARHGMIGYSPITTAEIAENKTGKQGWRAKLVDTIAQSNASAVIFRVSDATDFDVKKAAARAKDYLALLDIRVLDGIDDTEKSMAEMGVLEDPERYLQRGEPGAAGMRVRQVQAIVDGIRKKYKGTRAARIEVRKDDVDAFGKKIEGKPAKGGFDPATNTVTLLAHNLRSEADVLSTLRHELFTHFGLRQLFNAKELTEYLDLVRASRSNPEIAAIYNDVSARYPEMFADPYRMAEEVVARIAEKNPKATLLDKIRALVNRMLRRMGLSKIPLTMTEINMLIDRSAANLKRELYNPRIDTTVHEVLYQREDDPDFESARAKVGKKGKKVTIADHYRDVRDRIGLRIRQGMIDRYAALHELSDRAWILARGTHHVAGAVEAAFKYAKVYLDKDGAINIDVNGKGLAETLAPLGHEIDDFLFWIIGNRANQLMQEDREHLFTEAEINAFMRRNQGFMEDGRSRAEVYEQARKDLADFQESILKIGIETETISREEADTWRKDFYIPFYRLLEDDKGQENPRGPTALDKLTGQTAIKRLKGGTQNLNDPLANILMNWHHVLSASMKNQAATEVVLEGTAAGIIQPVSKQDKSKKAFFIRVNGQKRWFDIVEAENPVVPPELVLEALTMMNQPNWNNAGMKAARRFKRIFTIGVTASPEFRIANLIRDSLHSIAVTDQNYNVFDNIYQGWRGTKEGTDVEKRMMAGGGTIHFGLQYGDDPEAARLLIEEHIDAERVLTDEKGVKRYRHALKGMWTLWRDFGNRIENVNRAALYQKRIAEGASHFEAAHEARDMLDFFQGGSWPAVRFLTQTVPFLNARLQGLDKMWRAGWSPEQQKQFGIVIGAYVMATVGLYLLWRDDEDFQAREQWDRDIYHWFKVPGTDTAFRIPKPFEVGAIGTMAERGVEYALDVYKKGEFDGTHADLFAERLGHVFWQTFEFDPVPQFARPVLNVWANKDPFTDRPIESVSMEKLSPNERRYTYTSETAIAAARGYNAIAWENIELSPVQIQYLVDGYLGWAGSFSLGAIDNLISRPIYEQELPFLGESRPERGIDEWPITKRFVQTLPVKRTKYTTMFYENMKEINQVYADFANARKLGEMEKARQIMLENRDRIGLRKVYASASKKITQINNQMRRVRGNKNLTAKQKKVEIDRLRALKNAITERVIKKTIAKEGG